MKKLVVVGLLICTSTLLVAQPGWKWPDQIDLAKEKNALYSDAVKGKDYVAAVDPHNWLLENAPDLNASLYINGRKIYEGLSTVATDPAIKAKYQARTMEMSDLQIKYFGGEAKVLNRKAYTAYKFYKSNKSKYQELLDLFDRAFELNQDKILNNNLAAYMDVVRRFKLTGGTMSDEAIIDRYTKLSDVIDVKIKAGKNIPFLEKTQDTVDKMLTSIITVDCAFVEDKLVPKMRDTKDPKMAKKVFQLMLTGKCSDSPSFLEAAELMHASEPAFGLAKLIALKYGSAGNSEQALKFYDQALDLTDDNLKKAEIYYNKAQMHSSNGRKSAARTNARKALASDPSFKKAYTLVGDIYMRSYEECKEGISKVDDRLCFIAAFNQYKKAGSKKSMANAKAQFPSIAEIFELGLSEGQSMTCGCWINETVVLERRPN